MTTRKYSSRSQQTSLTAALTSSGTTANVVSGAALLGGATISAGETFTIVIDPDTALEEIVDIYSASGSPVSTNTLTIVRGVENAGIGVAHSAGAIVRHMLTGRDLRESNTHIESTTGHGATGAVVGTTNTQTLTNKTLTSPTITGTGAIAGTFTGNITGNVTGNVSGNAGTVTNGVYTTDTGTVTSTMIANGTIVDADINSSAAITKTKISGTAITAADTGTVTSTMIANDTIVNTDINTSAQIAYGKLNLTNTIVNADINASAAIDKTKISGTAITAADTGTVTSTLIADGTIVNGDINASAAIALSKLATDPLARANHTGTQAASTISDFDTQVRTSRLDQMAAPTVSVSANSQKITNLATPTSNTDAATKAYADQMILATEKGASNGVATLGSDGKLTTAQIPDVTITDTSVVSSQAAMLALTAQVGDVAVRTDLNKSFILKTAGASTLANWQELLTPTDSVLSVDGQTGAVSLSSTYATIANAANKLPLAGGTMSGNIAMGSNKITGLGTPTTTGDAATKDYADTKLPLAGGTMTGAVAMGTNKITGLGDPTNAQDAATKNYIDTTVIAPTNLTGVITSVGNVTSIASQTGTGTKFVVDTSPTLVTPNIGVATATSINGTTIPSSKTLVATDSTAYVVPSQTGNTGKYLKTDGSTSSWQTVDSLPSQTGNTGKYLKTDGTTPSWSVVSPVEKLYKSDTASVVFTKTGNGTLSIKAGTVITVNNEDVVKYNNATAVSMPTLTAGTDYFVYVNTAGTPSAVAATGAWPNPVASPPANSMLIGGFHYAPGGNATAQSGGNTTPQINEYSMWDLKWRPTALDPRGMTLVADKFWSDIYLLNRNPDVYGTSKYNTGIANGEDDSTTAAIKPAKFGGNGTTRYALMDWFNTVECLAAYGKELPTYQMFSQLAYGTTEQSAVASYQSTTGLTAAYTSKWGVMQSTGVSDIWARDLAGYVWSSGGENTDGRGGVYNLSTGGLFGGSYSAGSASGSRRVAYGPPIFISADFISGRGVCGHTFSA